MLNDSRKRAREEDAKDVEHTYKVSFPPIPSVS